MTRRNADAWAALLRVQDPFIAHLSFCPRLVAPDLSDTTYSALSSHSLIWLNVGRRYLPGYSWSS
ncbi:hypothetical protein [Citreimonas salinaria]|uniref:hypothetical protein n=1 Tax=Citreimonas salinaria TaxID=321339 RepID=UPI00115FDB0D|nr:hypothetical protein [Citreimonas salinaria]